jgi:uncharacterized protein YjgD (DUF1641 family)
MAEGKDVELSSSALEELLEVAAKLKESGLLDTLKAMLERYEDLMTLLADDRRLFHALAIMEGALNGLEESDPAKMKWATTQMMSCLTKGVEDVADGKVEPVGLMGLMKALREPEVMYGLGVLLAMARALGRCVMQSKK